MSGRERAVLALDLGTNDIKAGLVTLDGRLLGLARAGYPIDLSGGPGWAEQDPGAWWSAVVGAVRALHAPDLGEIVAIGVDGHGPTLVAVDDRGEATRAAITWLDTRTTEEAAELAVATGVRGWALGGLPAALWVERHEPAVADATRWYLSTWEWLAFRLAGVAVAPLIPDQLVPDPVVVGANGVPRHKLPPTGLTGTIVGELTATAADALGLRPGVPVVGGTVDAFASYHGAGLREPGDAYDPGGSAGGFGVYWDRPVDVPGAFVTPAPLAGRFSVGAAMAATGRALDWFPRQHRRWRHHHGGPARRGRDHATRGGRARLPPVPRRRTVATLGAQRPRCLRRPDAEPRPWPPGPRDRRGLGAGHPPRGHPDAGGRCPGDRDARLRGTGPQRHLERHQGRRHRLHGRGPGRARDRGRGLARSWAPSASAPIRTSRPPSKR